MALAKALSKEKQENQYLFTQNINLTSQVQEKNSAINQRDGAMMGILKNSSEMLSFLVEATERVTRTISACHQFVGVHKKPSPDSNSSIVSASRRESARRSTVKSPARGVVQPMVSGHTITKPVINLSRINMPRIRTSPNLSDIEEALTPERTNNTNSVRNLRNPPTLLTNRRVDGLMPERIRLTSPRMPDESDRLSDSRSRRSDRNSRHSRKFPRKSTERSPNNSSLSPVANLASFNSPRFPFDADMIRSPRVTLEDVSKLLQKSRRLNTRTLRESSELSADETPQEEGFSVLNSPEGCEPLTEPTYGFDPRKEELRTGNNSDDPLEGPSWLLDASQAEIPGDSIRNSTGLGESLTQSVVEPVKNDRKKSESPRKSWTTKTYRVEENSVDENPPEDEGDRCMDFGQFLGPPPISSAEEDKTSPNTGFIALPENVTRRRGHPMIDDDDFTLLINRRPQLTRHVPFDINELELPVLETPLTHPDEIEREPEVTTTVRMLTQTINRLAPESRDNVSIMGENTSVISPMRISSDFENERPSMGEDSTVAFNRMLKRKRTAKNILDVTSSDSESPSVTPKKAAAFERMNTRAKDPSAAKVVLEKLEETNNKISTSSRFSSLFS